MKYRNSYKDDLLFENDWPFASRKFPILGEYVRCSNIQRARLSCNNVRYSLVVKGRVEVDDIHKMFFPENEQ